MRRSLTKFQELPDDCTCNGEGLTAVSSVPRVGGLPELVTYECPACGHVETVEKHADGTQPQQ
jgi:rubredoxin